MIKVGITSGDVLVRLAPAEFKLLSGMQHNSVSDGDTISLQSLKKKIDIIAAKRNQLTDLKVFSQNIVDKLTEIGV